MLQYIIIIGFMITAFILMAFGLHISQYKKRNSGCCGGGHCEVDGEKDTVHSCYSEKINYLENHKALKT